MSIDYESLNNELLEYDETNGWASLWEEETLNDINSWIIRSIILRAKKNNISEEEYSDQINSLKYFLKDLAYCIRRNNSSFMEREKDLNKKLILIFPMDLSFDLNVMPKKDWGDFNSPINFDQIKEAFTYYKLREYLHCNWLDWFFLNASIYNEYAISYDTIQQGRHRGIYAGINWAYVWTGGNVFKLSLYGLITSFAKLILRWFLLPGLALYFIINNQDTIAKWIIGAWLIYIFFYFISIPRRINEFISRRKADNKAVDQLEIIASASLAARDEVLNPNQIKNIMLSGKISGNLFPSATFAILDHIIERSNSYFYKKDFFNIK